MRFSLATMVVLMALMLVGGLFSVRFISQSRNAIGPNLVVVMIDGTFQDHLDRKLCEGDWPLLNELREKGISFENCVAPSPWYPAAAASLLTGRYPSEHGLTMAHAHLSFQAQTLAEDCADSGFRTCAFIGNNSLLASTCVLQGFHRIIENTGIEVAVSGMNYITRHLGRYPVFGLIELDAKECGGAEGVNNALAHIHAELVEGSFFENGVLVVCAPGNGDICGNPNARSGAGLKADPMKEFLLLKGEPLCVTPGTVLNKPLSLPDIHVALKAISLGGTFHIRDLSRRGKAALTEMALPMVASSGRVSSKPPPRYCRLFWFDDRPFRCYVGPDGRLEFQDSNLQDISLSGTEEAEIRLRIKNYIENRVLVEDLNIGHTAGPVLDQRLASKLSGPWLRDSYQGHHLHAVEHLRLGEGLLNEGFIALALGEFRIALNIDPEYADALFMLAKAYTTIGPKEARPYFKAYLDKFGRTPGKESQVAEARKFLSIH